MDKINQNEEIFGFNNYSNSDDDDDYCSNILISFNNEVLKNNARQDETFKNNINDNNSFGLDIYDNNNYMYDNLFKLNQKKEC